MSEMNYEIFSSNVSKRSFAGANKYDLLLQTVEKFLKKDEIIVFYPKYLFVEEKQLEIQIYEKDRIVVLYQNDEEVKVRTLKYHLIDKMELLYTGNHEPLALRIDFRTGDSIELNAVEDTNSHWSETFTDKIQEIFKLLS